MLVSKVHPCVIKAGRQRERSSAAVVPAKVELWATEKVKSEPEALSRNTPGSPLG